MVAIQYSKCKQCNITCALKKRNLKMNGDEEEYRESGTETESVIDTLYSNRKEI